MNLNSRMARLPIAAMGITALCSAGLGVTAGPALAATEIPLNSGATTPVVSNIGFGTTANAATAYAVKSTESSISSMMLDIISGPTGGSLAFNKIASNGAPDTSFTEVPVADVNEVQTLTIDATGGTFTVTFDGATTAAVAENATAATLDTALEALASIGTGNVAVTGAAGGPYTLTFGGALAGQNLAQITAGAGSLTGGAGTATPATTTEGSPITPLGTLASTDNLYLTGDVPGTYVVRLFADSNDNGLYDADDDRTADLISLTVKDAIANTTSTSDDVALTVTAPASIGLTETATASATVGTLSTIDARGNTVVSGETVGALGKEISDILTLAFDGSDDAAAAATTFDGTHFTGTSPAQSAAGSLVTTADLGSVVKTATTTVADSGVDGLAYDNTDTEDVIYASNTATTVRPGTTAITYTVEATDGGDAVASTPVYFRLAAGTNIDVEDLETSAGDPDTNGDVMVTTNSSGQASLTVTVPSDLAVNANTFSVRPRSNGQFIAAATVATYQTAAADVINITSSSAELTNPISTASVTIEGELRDQYGALYQPPSSVAQQVTVSDDATGFATLSGGEFSYTYTPSTTPTAGQSDTIDFDHTTASTGTATIRWSSGTAAATVSLTTPADGATAVTIQDSTTPVATQANAGSPAFGNATGAVTGTVRDSDGAALPFTEFTLSGDGVWFTESNPLTTADSDDLQQELTMVTDSSGAFTAYAYFTQSGSVEVMATAGSAEDSASVTVSDATEAWTVSTNDAWGKPGDTLIVTGTLEDAFGNPVPSYNVLLGTGASTVGALGATTVATNSEGVWSTTFTPGSNQSGVVTLTATAATTAGGTTPISTDRVANSGWEDNAGVTVADGDYQDAGVITVKNFAVAVSASKALLGGGKTRLSGTANPGASVEVYSRETGERGYSLIGTVTAGEDGEWSAGRTITRSTQFFTKSEGVTSATAKTVVYSTQTVKAKALGNGKVRWYVWGAPNVKGKVAVFQGKKRIGYVTTNGSGDKAFTTSASKGLSTFRVYFMAPGTSLKGTSFQGRVK